MKKLTTLFVFVCSLFLGLITGCKKEDKSLKLADLKGTWKIHVEKTMAEWTKNPKYKAKEDEERIKKGLTKEKHEFKIKITEKAFIMLIGRGKKTREDKLIVTVKSSKVGQIILEGKPKNAEKPITITITLREGKYLSIKIKGDMDTKYKIWEKEVKKKKIKQLPIVVGPWEFSVISFNSQKKYFLDDSHATEKTFKAKGKFRIILIGIKFSKKRNFTPEEEKLLKKYYSSKATESAPSNILWKSIKVAKQMIKAKGYKDYNLFIDSSSFVLFLSDKQIGKEKPKLYFSQCLSISGDFGTTIDIPNQKRVIIFPQASSFNVKLVFKNDPSNKNIFLSFTPIDGRKYKIARLNIVDNELNSVQYGDFKDFKKKSR